MYFLRLFLASSTIVFSAQAIALPPDAIVTEDEGMDPNNGTDATLHDGLRKRKAAGVYSINVCRGITNRLRDATWRLDSAFCHRVGQSGSDTAYTVICAASNDQARTQEIDGNCPPDSKCIERNGFNQFGDEATDIFCVKRNQVREWVISAAHKRAPVTQCAAGFNNNGQRAGSMELVTNIRGGPDPPATDDYLVAPKDSWFQIGGKRIGNSGPDAILWSSEFSLRPGAAVQSCVTAAVGQVLHIISARYYPDQ